MNRLDEEEYGVKRQMSQLEDDLKDVSAIVNSVSAAAYTGEDMGLDEMGLEDCQLLLSRILSRGSERLDDAAHRLRDIDRSRDEAYEQYRLEQNTRRQEQGKRG